MGDAEHFKKLGNKAMQDGDNLAAIEHYTESLKLDGTNKIVLSNRSATYSKLGRFEEALKDANQVVEVDPAWARGYSRQATAYSGLNDFENAMKAYAKGLEIEPDNAAMKQGQMELIQQVMAQFQAKAQQQPKSQPTETAKPAETQPTETKPSEVPKPTETQPTTDKPKSKQAQIQALFSQGAKHFEGDAVATCQFFPELQHLCGDAEFQQIAAQIKRDPAKFSYYINASNQVREYVTFMVTLEARAEGLIDDPKPEAPQPTSSAPKKPTVVVSDEEAAANAVKDKGNNLFRAKDYQGALDAYSEAFAMFANPLYLTNRATVYTEMEQYELAIKDCDDALDLARSKRAPYQTLCRCLQKKGNVFYKQGDLKQAKNLYESAKLEYSTDKETLRLLAEVEKKIEENERNAYLDPELALKAKADGNEAFRAAKYPDAVKHYSESIKRDPSKPLVYTNRASSYFKLGEYKLAIKDCDAALVLDPKLVKACVRKGQCYTLLKDYNRAFESYQQGLDIDGDNQDCKLGLEKVMEILEEGGTDQEKVERKIAADPELRRLVSDPVMMQILDDMKRDPKAIQEHLRNPDVARNFQKLVEAGIVKLG